MRCRSLVVMVTAAVAAVTGAGASTGWALPLTGLELVTGASVTTTANPQLFDVQCPAGKVAVAGGAIITGGVSVADDIALIQSLPDGDPPTGWAAMGRDLADSGASWGLRVMAWCADEPEAFQRVGAVSPLQAAQYHGVVVSCPPGTEVLGTGVGVFGSALRAVPRHLLPQDPDLGTWEAFAENLDAGQGSWLLRADVLCGRVTPPPLVIRHHTTSQMGEVTSESFCPVGWQPLAAGLDHASGDGLQPHIRSMAPLGTSLGDYEHNWRIDLSGIPAFLPSSWTLLHWTVCHLDPLFADGFSSGGTAGWSSQAP